MKVCRKKPQRSANCPLKNIRKLVTRKYSYLVYDRIDAANDEAIMITIQHPARSRPYDDG